MIVIYKNIHFKQNNINKKSNKMKFIINLQKIFKDLDQDLVTKVKQKEITLLFNNNKPLLLV